MSCRRRPAILGITLGPMQFDHSDVCKAAEYTADDWCNNRNPEPTLALRCTEKGSFLFCGMSDFDMNLRENLCSPTGDAREYTRSEISSRIDGIAAVGAVRVTCNRECAVCEIYSESSYLLLLTQSKHQQTH